MTKAERDLLLLMANWLATTIAFQRDRVVVLNSALRDRLTDLRREQQAEAEESSNALACFKSSVSKPSVKQP